MVSIAGRDGPHHASCWLSLQMAAQRVLFVCDQCEGGVGTSCPWLAEPSAGETDDLRASATLAQPASGTPSGPIGQTIHSRQHTDSHTDTEPQDMFMCDRCEGDLTLPVHGWTRAIRW